MPKLLQKQMDKLKSSILIIGAQVEENLLEAVRALQSRNAELAQKIIDADAQIDEMEVDLEEECLKILALYQPVAKDLRYIVALLKINNDLERIGDLASNLARRARFAVKKPDMSMPDTFTPMTDAVKRMLRQSLDALVKVDAELAYQVCATDDIVDAFHRENFKLIAEGIAREPERIECYINLFQASMHLERIADQTTNIAEDVIYMIQGDIIRHHFSKKPKEVGKTDS